MPADRDGEHGRDGGPAPRVLGPGESETLLTGKRSSGLARALEAPARRPGPSPLLERLAEARSYPFLRVLLYYALLVGLIAALAYHVPMVRSAFLAPSAIPLEEGGSLAGPVGDFGGRLSLDEALERAVMTLLVIAGALLLVVPVAWVYMLTKRFRYDPALVSSVIILPIVVSGIALVVKNSIALAFALAGIVAAVRFRNTLKDPRDAVYIFLVIGIGLSAGVQALDVALVMSFAFNQVVLLVWRYNVGTIYSGSYARTGILSVGRGRLLMAQDPEAQRQVRRRMLEPAAEIPTDGILLVHSHQPALARVTVQEALADMARDWRLVDPVEREEGLVTLEYLVRLKKQAAPTDLVGSLDERWGAQVDAAEYVPFRTRRRKRKKKE
jgi:sRNA-binding regulator protein Hfq